MIGLRNRLSEWLEKGLLKVEGEKGKQMGRERELWGERRRIENYGNTGDRDRPPSLYS
jgi:hypothetical protein